MTTWLIFVLVGLVIGGIFLQIFLAKQKSKWLGIVLPMLCFLVSVIGTLSVPMYTTGGTHVQVIDEDGAVIEENVVEQKQASIADKGFAVSQAITIFILYNIPTAVLLIIYFACRESLKKKRQLEKMNIQDLE